MAFGRKRNRGLFQEVEDNREIVHDFRRRTRMLFESYRYVDYKKPPEYDMEKMKEENAQCLAKLIAADAIDAGNEDCLIEKILGPVRDGLRYLDDQYLEHMDFYDRQRGNMKAHCRDIDRILTMWQEKEKLMSLEYEETLKLWKRYNGEEREEE